MAKKATVVPAEPEAPEALKAVEPKKEAPQGNSDNNELLDDEVAERRNQRRSEWGTQCDRWLIRCQQKGKTVLLHLGEFNPKNAESGVKAVPKRIDQHFVQFDFGNGREVWVGKEFIAGIEDTSNEE